MRDLLTRLKVPALASSLLTLPFLLLEWVNRHGLGEPFPVVLFALLWLLPLVFILVLQTLLRDLRAGEIARRGSLRLLFRMAFLALTAWVWIALIADQMHCFLGVPNCD